MGMTFYAVLGAVLVTSIIFALNNIDNGGSVGGIPRNGKAIVGRPLLAPEDCAQNIGFAVAVSAGSMAFIAIVLKMMFPY